MINAGDLDRRITLQKPVVTRGSDGAENLAYSSVVTVWANYMAEGGKEVYLAKRTNAEVRALFQIRYRSGITPKWRVKFGNRYFEILFINDTNARQGELVLACKELV